MLLVVLGLSVALLGAALYHLATSDAPQDLGLEDDPEDGGAEEKGLPLGAPRPGARPRGERTGNGTERDDEGDIFWGDRDPTGEVFDVTPESLRAVLAERHFEEIRRQINALQEKGTAVPADVVSALLDMLKTEGSRIDAMLALGQITDDATGRALAELAADANAPEEVRVAALEALAKSGQAAGLTHVKQLAETSTADTKLSRQALFALAAMGGRDGVTPLVSLLTAHPDDALTDAVVTALAKARNADAVLAQELRTAREGGDVARLKLLLRIGNQAGTKSGDEMRAEVIRLVESPDALAALPEDPESRLELYATAVAVAASMGGDALDAAVRVARDQTGVPKGVALHALRQARGDAAAASIAKLWTPGLDARTRLDVVGALGSTESRKATPILHEALLDENQSVRHEAAAGIGKVRDPASVPVLLEGLAAAKSDTTLARLYVEALGTIGVKDAVPHLEALVGSDDPVWKMLQGNIRRALNRIHTGNPQAKSIK